MRRFRIANLRPPRAANLDLVSRAARCRPTIRMRARARVRDEVRRLSNRFKLIQLFPCNQFECRRCRLRLALGLALQLEQTTSGLSCRARKWSTWLSRAIRPPNDRSEGGRASAAPEPIKLIIISAGARLSLARGARVIISMVGVQHSRFFAGRRCPRLIKWLEKGSRAEPKWRSAGNWREAQAGLHH